MSYEFSVENFEFERIGTKASYKFLVVNIELQENGSQTEYY